MPVFLTYRVALKCGTDGSGSSNEVRIGRGSRTSVPCVDELNARVAANIIVYDR
jgi:hypothetical protein